MDHEAGTAHEQVIPPAVAALIQATNEADRERFASAFTADAFVEDGGRRYHGRPGIELWDQTDNVGVGMQFDLVSVSRVRDDEYDVKVRATSRRFTGTGTMHITLRDGLISRLIIG